MLVLSCIRKLSLRFSRVWMNLVQAAHIWMMLLARSRCRRAIKWGWERWELELVNVSSLNTHVYIYYIYIYYACIILHITSYNYTHIYIHTLYISMYLWIKVSDFPDLRYKNCWARGAQRGGSICKPTAAAGQDPRDRLTMDADSKTWWWHLRWLPF